MNGFASIVDQKRPVHILRTILNGGRVPHALLFTGIEGVGKRTAAFVFARALNCARRRGDATASNAAAPAEAASIPCEQCRSCKKINAGSHPDILVVKPEKALIRIQQIRDLTQVLAMKPYEARHRIVVIEAAHCMNPEAANSLLKILEEPPPQTVLMLTAEHLDGLLPTVVSRCQHLRFAPLRRDLIVDHLVRRKGLSSDAAEVAAILANGSMAKALKADVRWHQRRQWLLRATGLKDDGGRSMDSIGAALEVAERLSRDRKRLPDMLDILKTYVRDLLVIRFHPDVVINRDMLNDVDRLARRCPVDNVLEAYDAVESALRTIEKNGNARLTLDVMMMTLLRAFRRRQRNAGSRESDPAACANRQM